jgi:hypothetical protein
MPNRPCAVALLNYFLGQQGGTTCPSVCKSKIEAWISSRLSSTQNFLSKRLFKGCGRFESMSWDEDNLLEGWGAVEDGDLFFAFHNFNFSFIGSAFLSCGPNVECCCACTGGTRLYGHLLDDFDFCSSLPPRGAGVCLRITSSGNPSLVFRVWGANHSSSTVRSESSPTSQEGIANKLPLREDLNL